MAQGQQKGQAVREGSGGAALRGAGGGQQSPVPGLLAQPPLQAPHQHLSLWSPKHLGQQQEAQVQVRRGEEVEVLLQCLLLDTTL